MNKPVSGMGTTFPMSAASVNFTNGMIVTAEDLSAAMAYPLTLMQSVNRAVFGCGVVCGFDIEPDPDLCERQERCDPCDDSSEMAYPSFVVEVGRGTALDCSGLPVELCKPVRVDLGDRNCGCEVKEGEVCLYIRRISAPAAPRGDCCAPESGAMQCSRLQDHVEIRAFPRKEVPDHACMRPFDDEAEEECPPKDGNSDKPTPGAASADRRNSVRETEGSGVDCETVCACLKTCGDCQCCGEGWILIGCLTLCKNGIVADSFESAKKHRKWIKTIECFCPPETKKAEPANVLQNTYVEVWSQEAAPEFKEEVREVIGDDKRAAMLLAAGANRMEHVVYLLEARKKDFQEAFGLKSADVLNAYRKRAEDRIAKYRDR